MEASKQFLVVLSVAVHTGCALITTLDHPAAQIKLTGALQNNQVQRVWFAPVDFFDRQNTDPAKVCLDKRWSTKVDASGNATFKARTESHFINFLNMDANDEALDSMMRDLALCGENQDGKVEFLTSLNSFDATFLGGATLMVDCQRGDTEWTCSAVVND